jgi:hypothetical protein
MHLRIATVIAATCALFSGASLIVAVLAHWSLGVALAAAAVFAAAVAAFTVASVPVAARQEFARRALAGVLGGLAGVAAYDLVRFGLVAGLHLQVRPFEALPLFGALIAGYAPGSSASWIIGTAYHYLNGVLFGMSYGIALGRKAWTWGIVWALGLELLMLSLYPGWLRIPQALMGEFTLVSLSGHLAYGTALGLVTTRVLRRSRPATRPKPGAA